MEVSSLPRPERSAEPTVSRWAPLVVWGTVAAGVLVLASSLIDTVQAGAWGALPPLLLLAAVAELLSVETYAAHREGITFSMGVVVTIAAAVALAHGAPLASLPIAFVQVFVYRSRGPKKHLFNLANAALPTAASRLAYVWLGPATPELDLHALVGIFATVATYQIVNVGLLSLVVSLHSGESFKAVIRGSAWYAPNKLAVGLIGGCIALVYGQLGPIGALIFAAPLGVLRYTLTMYTRQTRRTIEAVESQARHDLLTGLPNRLLLRERLEASLDAVDHPEGVSGALLLLDLDRFKEVNDTFGHHVGDRLLDQIGRRLADSLVSNGLVARLGGDEFAILLPDALATQPELVARSLLALLDEPMLVEGQHLRVGASIGVVHYPEHGRDPDALLRRADVAMYVAKREQSGVVRYDPAQDEHTPERLALAGELREAIEQDQLVLAYQPQVELGSGKVLGVEALVRWSHPRRGLIPPGEFITMAGHTGLLEPLTWCVLRIALRQCRAWLNAGRTLRTSVNVSAHDLNDNFPGRVEELLRSHNVPAYLLQLEITEDAMMADPERAENVLRELHRLGVSISIDDFGTGYSSLAYLAQLPIDELKIDRTFVMGMRDSQRQAVIVRSTIGLGHDLGLLVIAEGVEDQATQDQLQEYGCDAFQGYFASKPVAADVLERWLADRWAASTLPVLRAA